jgi:hypothetical protein
LKHPGFCSLHPRLVQSPLSYCRLLDSCKRV